MPFEFNCNDERISPKRGTGVQVIDGPILCDSWCLLSSALGQETFGPQFDSFSAPSSPSVYLFLPFKLLVFCHIQISMSFLNAFVMYILY